MHRLMLVLTMLVIAVATPAAATAQPVGSPTAPPPVPPLGKPMAEHLLAQVKSWGYQLQKADPAEIARSAHDLVVIDYSRNGTDAGRYLKSEVTAMQRKPDGGRRLVLAYLSIGEAEDYRFYWNPKWVEPAPLRQAHASAPVVTVPAPAVAASEAATVRIPRLVAPGWLGRENERWHGNYHVRFWYDGWQEIMFYADTSYLRRIQDAGFDGVYLDRVDAYYGLEGDREDAARRMVDLVSDLAKVARQRVPEFLVLAQNGEELLRFPKYLATINGLAKEDLLFGNASDSAPNASTRIAASLGDLALARTAKRPVLVVEYLDSPDLIAQADSTIRSHGYIPYFAPRKLDRLVLADERRGMLPGPCAEATDTSKAERKAAVLAGEGPACAPTLAPPTSTRQPAP